MEFEEILKVLADASEAKNEIEITAERAADLSDFRAAANLISDIREAIADGAPDSLIHEKIDEAESKVSALEIYFGDQYGIESGYLIPEPSDDGSHTIWDKIVEIFNGEDGIPRDSIEIRLEALSERVNGLIEAAESIIIEYDLENYPVDIAIATLAEKVAPLGNDVFDFLDKELEMKVMEKWFEEGLKELDISYGEGKGIAMFEEYVERYPDGWNPYAEHSHKEDDVEQEFEPKSLDGVEGDLDDAENGDVNDAEDSFTEDESEWDDGGGGSDY